MHALQLRKVEEKLDQALCIFLLKEQKAHHLLYLLPRSSGNPFPKHSSTWRSSITTFIVTANCVDFLCYISDSFADFCTEFIQQSENWQQQKIGNWEESTHFQVSESCQFCSIHGLWTILHKANRMVPAWKTQLQQMLEHRWVCMLMRCMDKFLKSTQKSLCFPFGIEEWVAMLFVPFRVVMPSILRHGTQAHRSFGNDCITMLAGCPAWLCVFDNQLLHCCRCLCAKHCHY